MTLGRAEGARAGKEADLADGPPIPVERQRQLRDLLGQLLARLLAATRDAEVGHD